MKTTIELPDQLAREAKLFAAERRTTLRALVLQGLEHVIKEKQVSAKNRAKNLFAAMDQALDSYPILAVSEDVFWAALQIKERYKLSYWDSAIIAAAVQLGCHTVYSEDLNHGQMYAGVRVINPFAV